MRRTVPATYHAAGVPTTRACPTELRSGDDVATLVRPAGAAVALPVMRFPGHGDWAATEASIHRTIRTYRWALDVLTAEGAPRLGFYGHSGGAFLGILLSVADDRLEALVLAGFGAGTLTRVAALDGVGPEYLARLARYDPRRQLPRRHAARVLVQHGRHTIDDPAAYRDRLAFFGL